LARLFLAPAFRFTRFTGIATAQAEHRYRRSNRRRRRCRARRTPHLNTWCPSGYRISSPAIAELREEAAWRRRARGRQKAGISGETLSESLARKIGNAGGASTCIPNGIHRFYHSNLSSCGRRVIALGVGGCGREIFVFATWPLQFTKADSAVTLPQQEKNNSEHVQRKRGTINCLIFTLANKPSRRCPPDVLESMAIASRRNWSRFQEFLRRLRMRQKNSAWTSSGPPRSRLVAACLGRRRALPLRGPSCRRKAQRQKFGGIVFLNYSFQGACGGRNVTQHASVRIRSPNFPFGLEN
jgi:hypothetical protein